MKLPKPLLQLGAIVSSAVLIGAFVCYRAGAFNSITETATPAVDSGTTPKFETVVIDPAAPGTDPSFFYSSKSIAPVIVPPSQTAPVPQPSAPPAPTTAPIMPGSKSFQPFGLLKGVTPNPSMPNDLPSPGSR
jgi:hypothetical protein